MIQQRIKPFSGEFDTRELGEVSRKALGVSEDNYSFNPGIDSEKASALKKAAFSLGLHPSQAKKFLDKTVEVLNEVSQEKSTAEKAEWQKKLGIEGDVDEALKKQFADQGRDFDQIKKTLGDQVYNPDILKVFNPSSDETGATATDEGGAQGNKKFNPQAVDQQIQALIASKEYQNPTNEKYSEYHAKVVDLEKQLLNFEQKGQ